MQVSKLAPAEWAAFTEGEGDGYGGPLSALFDESEPSAAKDVMRKVMQLKGGAVISRTHCTVIRPIPWVGAD